MTDDKRIGVATRLFIDGRQVGSDSHYMDYYADLKEAVADTRTFYVQEGYKVEAIEVDQLPRWPNTEPVPTLVVRLSHIAKQPQP
jgi:hypothetical protein